MSYFPSILSDPQLAITRSEKNLILGAASSAWFKKRTNLVIYITAIITWAITMALTTVYLERLANSATLYTVLLWTIALPLFIFGIHYFIFHFAFRKHLFNELRARGHDVCISCGYNLIDIPQQQAFCPECGKSREPLPQ